MTATKDSQVKSASLMFSITPKGFIYFTDANKNITKNYDLVRTVNGKTIYFVEGAKYDDQGVAVIVKDGKLQAMMPSTQRIISI